MAEISDIYNINITILRQENKRRVKAHPFMRFFSTEREITNDDICKNLQTIEAFMSNLHTDLLEKFSIAEFVVATKSTQIVENNKIYVTTQTNEDTIKEGVFAFILEDVASKIVDINFDDLNPAPFSYGFADSIYVFAPSSPAESFFATYESQESIEADIGQMFIEIVNGQNRFTRIDDQFPIYHKYRRVNTAFVEKYPWIAETETVIEIGTE